MDAEHDILVGGNGWSEAHFKTKR